MSLRSLVALLALAALVAPAHASLVEETTDSFVAYQFDAETMHDAPDLCERASAQWSLPVDASTDGVLVAPDDLSDVFVVDVPSTLKGQRLRVGLSEVADAGTLEVAAFAPGCAGSVLDRLNWPAPEPSPPAPAAGQTQHRTDVSHPLRCDSRQWIFGLDQLQGIQEPATIHLAWTDGTEGPVDLYGRYGNVAVYATGDNLGILLKGAWANLDASWKGRFTFAVGPCDAVDGGAVYGAPPKSGVGFLEFTPVRAGPHVVQVTYREPVARVLMPIPQALAGGLEADAGGGAHGAETHLLASRGSLASAEPEPVTVTMSCHGCVREAEDLVDLVSYRLAAIVR